MDVPAKLVDMSLSVVVETAIKYYRSHLRCHWKEYWEQLGFLPVTLKTRLCRAISTKELITDDNIKYLIHSQLEELYLYNCLKGDFSINLVAATCTRLRRLDIGARLPPPNVVTALSLMHLFSSCRALEDVRMDNCFDLNDDVVEILVYNNLNLKILKFFGCLSVSDKSVKLIADNCCNLTRVDLSRTSVTDDGVCYLAKGVCATQIEELLINDCTLVTHLSISVVSKCCKKLKIFSFNGTRATAGGNLFDNVLRPRLLQFHVPL